MSFEVLVSIAIFAFASAATPGPNNLLLLASGLRVGLLRTLPFAFGINFGFSVLLVSIGYGLGRLFEIYHSAQLVLKLVGTFYFLYLAWTLLIKSSATGNKTARELGFWGGAFFQIVNPKAWLMGITAIALFLPQDWTGATLANIVLIFMFLGLPASVAWAGIGQSLTVLVSDERRMRIFNSAMVMLFVFSIVPVWMPYK